MNNTQKVNKKQVEQMFREAYPNIELSSDKPMKRQAWNDYTNGLCEDGIITEHQRTTFSYPYWLRAN